MSKILISLGCDDIQFLRSSDNKLYSQEDLLKLTDLFLKIEAVGKGINEIYGCTLQRLLTQYQQSDSKSLPRYLARIRTGNEEELRFLKDSESYAGASCNHRKSPMRIQPARSQEKFKRPPPWLPKEFLCMKLYESHEIEKLLGKCHELDVGHDSFRSQRRFIRLSIYSR